MEKFLQSRSYDLVFACQLSETHSRCFCSQTRAARLSEWSANIGLSLYRYFRSGRYELRLFTSIKVGRALPTLVMSKFERVLAVDSTELPDCSCRVEMHLISTMPVPGGGSEIRIFRCPDCNHELRLTVWHNDLSANAR